MVQVSSFILTNVIQKISTLQRFLPLMNSNNNKKYHKEAILFKSRVFVSVRCFLCQNITKVFFQQNFVYVGATWISIKVFRSLFNSHLYFFVCQRAGFHFIFVTVYKLLQKFMAAETFQSHVLVKKLSWLVKYAEKNRKFLRALFDSFKWCCIRKAWEFNQDCL